ncbi:MAG TPA: hypothetical protein VKV03_13165 [Candidatus Binataceae bacterium]|nr:hypothetical protein [Candidatus Binataceae bacterium]
MPAVLTGSDGRSSPSFVALLAVFSIETIAINLARLPESMRFDRFAFCDHGANLTLQYLIDNGLRPSLDFGYHYGLLPALVGRIWFAVFGATPWAYQGAMLIADLLCAWALAKILSQLKIGVIGIALAIITLGYSFQASYINFAHAIEAVLLSHALAQQLRSSRSTSLALCAAAVFDKPSMGYIYGLVLVVLIVRDLAGTDSAPRRIAAALAPATIVFVSLAITLSAIFGMHTVLHTALPIEGATAYHALNYGLLGTGREFWDPQKFPWTYYAIDVAGFWIAGTLFLFGSALLQLRRADHSKLPIKEAILTCAILHLAFLVLFFGNQWSWIYYPYLLTIGVAVATGVGPTSRRVGVILCAVALISYTDLAYWTHRWWQTTTRDAATAGLWAPEDERQEWQQVLSSTHRHKVVMLDSMGAAELLFPGFENPVSLFLTRGLMQRDDVRRKLAQLATAEVAVVPITIEACSGVPDAPEFRDALKSFDLAWEGKHFQVYRRRAAP